MDIQATGTFNAGDIEVIDTVGNMTGGLCYTTTTLVGKTGQITFTPYNSNQWVLDAGNGVALGFWLGPILMSSAPLYGEVTFASSKTATVTNANCQIITSGSDYFFPILALMPVNSAAPAAGNVAPAFTSTGFTLHADVSNSGTFAYKVLGYGAFPTKYS
jgi:hypothetical protein